MGTETESPIPPTPTPVVEPKNSKVFRYILIGIGILFIILIFSLLLTRLHNSNNTQETGQACSASSQDALMKQAASVLEPTQAAQLSQGVTQIKKLPNYQKDANCMYVLTLYDVNIFNVASAQANLKLFNQAYNGHNLKSSLSAYASVPTLRASVTDLNQHLQQDQQNSNALSPKQPKKP